MRKKSSSKRLETPPPPKMDTRRMLLIGAGGLAGLVALIALIWWVLFRERSVSFPNSVPVAGKVSFSDGRPVSDVRIFFEPMDSPAGASGSVVNGTFELQTVDNMKGAFPGKYQVIFRLDMSNADNLAKSTAALKQIPRKYQQGDSPLEVEIPSGGKTDFDFKLDPN